MPLAYIPPGWAKGKEVFWSDLPALAKSQPQLLIDSGNGNYTFVDWSNFRYWPLESLLLQVCKGEVFLAERV